MTERDRPDPAAGWGDSLPLPLTPEAPPGPARGDIAHAKRAIRRASLEDGAPPTDTVEVGGPKGLEPTRYSDWEQKGRCTDF